jgi:hypothetical protein
MLEFIGLNPSEWTPVAVVSLIVLMILFGWLIPRWQVREIMKDRDEWKAMAIAQQKISTDLAEAAKNNAEPAKAIAEAITSDKDRAEAGDG